MSSNKVNPFMRFGEKKPKKKQEQPVGGIPWDCWFKKFTIFPFLFFL
jgi:hypothetical protein